METMLAGLLTCIHAMWFPLLLIIMFRSPRISLLSTKSLPSFCTIRRAHVHHADVCILCCTIAVILLVCVCIPLVLLVLILTTFRFLIRWAFGAIYPFFFSSGSSLLNLILNHRVAFGLAFRFSSAAFHHCINYKVIFLNMYVNIYTFIINAACIL